MDPDSFHSLLLSIPINPIGVDVVVAFLAAVFLLGASGFISASEIAFFSLSPQDCAVLSDDEHPKDKWINSLLERSEYLLATILIANNFVNVSVIILCNYIISSLLVLDALQSFILQSVLLTFLLLLFGEIMPKIYATHNSLKFARRSVSVLLFLSKVFKPLSNVLVRSTHIVNKHITHKNVNISMNELSQALEMTDVDGNDEKEMLEDIIKFGGKRVEEIMTPRVDMTDIDITIDYKSLLQIIVETGYSRIPVYSGSEDSIKGIIYIKDLLPYLNAGAEFKWQTLLRPAYFVPETKMIDDLLEDFRTKKIHIAIVVDEFGGTSGIVTLEDILEEIVGEISDEYDDEEKQFIRIDDHTFIFEGKTLLNDFYKITGIDEPVFEDIAEEAETVAGLILAIKEDFPQPKERVVYKNFRFTVLEMDKRRITKVKFKILAAHEKVLE